MTPISLHKDDGSEICIASDDIQAFYPKGENASVIVFKSHGTLTVSESLQEINSLLKGV